MGHAKYMLRPGNGVVFHRQRFFSTARNPTYDVAIAGAGITGLATAFQLKKADLTLRVLVCERTASLGMDPWSTAFARLYSFDETMQLAMDGIEAYCRWGVLAFGTWKSPSPGPVPFGCTESPGASTRLSRLAAFCMDSEVMDEGDVRRARPFAPTRT